MGEAAVWYAEGLAFSCCRCGNCCGGAPGYVWVSPDEIHALADQFGLSDAEFCQRYTWRVARRGVSLIEKPDHDCIFFVCGQGCSVYDLRPRQCRTWPFWRSVVDNPDSWDFAGQGCPGINQGHRHDQAVIAQHQLQDGLP